MYQGEDYTVQADDWLSKLSDKFLGDVLAYGAITHYTNQKNSEDDSYAKITNSDVIEVGDKIYIPTQEEATSYFAMAAGESLGAGSLKLGAIMPLSAPGSEQNLWDCGHTSPVELLFTAEAPLMSGAASA